MTEGNLSWQWIHTQTDPDNNYYNNIIHHIDYCDYYDEETFNRASQPISNISRQGLKIRFFHILNIVGLRYGKNNGICFGAKYPFIFKKNENNRQPSKLPFETPNPSTSLTVSRVKINGYMVLKTLIY